jgi:hypothetical protein
VEKVQNSFWQKTSIAENPQDVQNVRDQKLQTLENGIGDMRSFALINHIGLDYSIEFQQSKPDAQMSNPVIGNIMGGVEFSFFPNGFPTEKIFSHIWSRFQDGITRIWKSTVSTMIKVTIPVISALQPKNKTWETSAELEPCKINLTLPMKKSNCFEAVYDLVDAGPRHRFMVMTDAGTLIVHNSGYGLGPVGFQARFAPNETFELAQLAINTYRKEIAPKVVKFWYGLFQASVDAVWCEMSKTYSYEGIEFRKEGDFLTMKLPSLRKIWYHRPRKATTYTPAGDERPAWSFMSYQGKKFRRHLAWHGMITADCIQGSARDMMTSAAKRAEKAGLFAIFKVHDELVFEETDRPDLETIVAQIMEEREPWMIERRLRVKANVDKMLRYKK